MTQCGENTVRKDRMGNGGTNHGQNGRDGFGHGRFVMIGCATMQRRNGEAVSIISEKGDERL